MIKSTQRPNRVRIADPSEEGSVMDMCRELHAENGIFKMSEEKVGGLLKRAFTRQGGILGVIGQPGKLEGMIYLLMSTMWYSDDTCWEELYTYVRPQYRKSRDALDLLHFAKWAAEQSGFPLFIGVISNEQTQQKVNMYQRQFASEEALRRTASVRTEIRALCAEQNDIGKIREGDGKRLDQLMNALENGASSGSFFLYNYQNGGVHNGALSGIETNNSH
jgi:hypothetical protein